MKRYDLEDTSPRDSHDSWQEMVEEPDGEWVEYDEAEREILRLQAKLTYANDQMRAMRGELQVDLPADVVTIPSEGNNACPFYYFGCEHPANTRGLVLSGDCNDLDGCPLLANGPVLVVRPRDGGQE